MTSPKLIRLTARATAGDAEAQAALAQAYEQGKGIKKNPQEAMTYWRLAATKDHPRALARLVEHCLSAEHRDEAQAIAYARRGAATGDPVMMSLLGRMALEGELMPMDLALANEMLSRAAQRQNIEALICYGHVLMNGWGVAPDVKNGLWQLDFAARLGSETAMGMLAKLYDEGSVTPRDPYQAYRFYGMSSDITAWHDHGEPFTRLLAELTQEQAAEARRVVDMHHYEQGHTDWSGPAY